MNKSTIFWNVLYIIVMIVAGFTCIELLYFFMTINSVMFFGLFDKSVNEKHFSVFISPIFVICAVAFGLGAGVWFIYKNTIIKFNKWLDKPKKEEIKNYDDRTSSI